jgi:hypothetical protein
MPAPGRKRLHSKLWRGWGWKRAKDDMPTSGVPPHGALRPDWDPIPRTFDPGRVDPTVEPLRCDPSAEYGRKPDGVPYTETEYAQRFHILGPDRVAWPPNQGAVRGTKLDYSCAHKFLRDFGDTIDRLGERNGGYFGLVEDKAPATYEARAIHYGSLYHPLRAYTVKPDKFPKTWRIRVMDTAPALGQPGGSVGLIFLDETGHAMPVDDLFKKGVL